MSVSFDAVQVGRASCVSVGAESFTGVRDMCRAELLLLFAVIEVYSWFGTLPCSTVSKPCPSGKLSAWLTLRNLAPREGRDRVLSSSTSRSKPTRSGYLHAKECSQLVK